MSAAMKIQKPYQQTGRVLFDALLFTCHSYGCTAITHDSRVIRCTRNEQQYSIITTAQTTCIDILITIGAMKPQPPRPAKQQNIEYMSERSYNKAKAKRGKKRHAA